MHSVQSSSRPRQLAEPGTGSAWPSRLFDTTPEQRLARARRQFFDEGVRPTGVVAEAVIQSWTRCLQQRQHPARTPEFDTVTISRVHSVLGRHRGLLQAAAPELAHLARTLAGTPVVGLLLDPAGVVMHVTPTPPWTGERILPASARIGVCLAEERIGTNAPALTAITGRAAAVQGAEHFADAVTRMACVAAPVRDHHGQLVAVLDLSVEDRPFGFDASLLCDLSATAIENQLLRSTSPAPLVLSLHCNAAMLDTALAGLVGVDGAGRVAWLNQAAARLLGLDRVWPLPPDASTDRWLGQTLAALLGMTAARTPQRLPLPNGLLLWTRASLQREAAALDAAPAPPLAAAPGHGPAALPSPDGPQAAPSRATPPPGPSLRESEHSLVVRTVHDCQGNVSKAARLLGVSRGLVYRQLRRCLDS